MTTTTTSVAAFAFLPGRSASARTAIQPAKAEAGSHRAAAATARLAEAA